MEVDCKKGVMNGPLKFLTARKILPLLDLLAKFKRVLACSCFPNFCVARQLAKQIFNFCSCSQKNRSAWHARECSQRPFVKNDIEMWDTIPPQGLYIPDERHSVSAFSCRKKFIN